MRKKTKAGAKQRLINRIRHRIRLLEGARQHYEQNPNLIETVKIANIQLVQNDIEALRKALRRFSRRI